MKDNINITSSDYWYKIVDFLQQNWGVIETTDTDCTIYFFGDTAGIFDQINFRSLDEAKQALIRNEFKQYDNDEKAQEFIVKPKPPFHYQSHPNGQIYSSGRYWQ